MPAGKLHRLVDRRAVRNTGQKGHLIDPQPQGISHVDLHLIRLYGGKLSDIIIQQQLVLKNSEAQPDGQGGIPFVQSGIPDGLLHITLGPRALAFPCGKGH
jgi:hypothetical protein